MLTAYLLLNTTLNVKPVEEYDGYLQSQKKISPDQMDPGHRGFHCCIKHHLQ